MATENELLQLAEEVGNNFLQEQVSACLDLGEDQKARIYILGALDALVLEGDMSYDEAHAKYQLLGFSPEKASEIRQNAHHAR